MLFSYSLAVRTSSRRVARSFLLSSIMVVHDDGSLSPRSVSSSLVVVEDNHGSNNNDKNKLTAASFGSRLGTDVEMIAANHRQEASKSRSKRFFSSTSTTPASSASSTEMKDEYGQMDDSGHSYIQTNYRLEAGRETLPEAQLRYQTYGTLNANRDNCIVVCHALTGNASLHAWWGDLLGEGRAFDTSKYFVVCCNILGSCYGSTSPASINPETNQRYGLDFPDISVKDTVRLQLLLLQQELKIQSVKCVIGGSFGGMQAVEFAVQGASREFADFSAQDGPFVRSVIPIACGAAHTAWQIGISEVQRQCIYKDPMWNVDPFQATSGLELARQIGMVSYRTPVGYTEKFGRTMQTDDSPLYGSSAQWKVKSYLEYQGSKFLGRFDPVTYVKMTEQMDSHDIARGRADSVQRVLSTIDIPALVLGIDSDVLYPLREQQELAEHMPNATLAVIHSDDGHDGFLLEQEQVGNHITDFLSRHG